MIYDPQEHDRQSHRLKGYDYALPAPYFVTLCTEKFRCLLGKVQRERMLPNEQGKMVEGWLTEIEKKFPGVLLDAFQVMPNHLHAIIVIMGCGLDVAAKFGIGMEDLYTGDANDSHCAPLPPRKAVNSGLSPQHPTLGRIVQWFKTMSTNNYIRGVREAEWQPFSKRLWQRDYFDHIIRDEVTLERTGIYVRNNPVYWSLEREHPDNMGKHSFDQWLLQNEL
jgi:REP element-mobilizing transposase RayT